MRSRASVARAWTLASATRSPAPAGRSDENRVAQATTATPMASPGNRNRRPAICRAWFGIGRLWLCCSSPSAGVSTMGRFAARRLDSVLWAASARRLGSVVMPTNPADPDVGTPRCPGVSQASASPTIRTRAWGAWAGTRTTRRRRSPSVTPVLSTRTAKMPPRVRARTTPPVRPTVLPSCSSSTTTRATSVPDTWGPRSSATGCGCRPTRPKASSTRSCSTPGSPCAGTR